jgi:hypothetical protein
LIGYPDQSITLFDAILATFDHHFDTMRVDVWR